MGGARRIGGKEKKVCERREGERRERVSLLPGRRAKSSFRADREGSAEKATTVEV